MVDLLHFKLYADLRSILVFVISFLAAKYVTKKLSRNIVPANLKIIPGPFAFPIIGNSIDLLLGARYGLATLLIKYVKTYGKTFRLWIGNDFVLVLTDPKDASRILFSSSCLKKSRLSLPAREFFNNSLIVADLWKHKRKAYQACFTKTVAVSQIAAMNEIIHEYVEKAVSLVNGPESDWKNIMIDMSLDIFLKTRLNFATNGQRKDESYIFVNRLSTVLRRYIISGFFPWPIIRSLWNLIYPLNTGELKKSINDFIVEVLFLHEKSNKIGTGNIRMDNGLYSESSPKSFVRVLEKVKRELDEDNLESVEILFLLLAASEPLGFTAASCFLALAADSEIQEKVYLELHQVFGDSDRPADKSDLLRLPYLDQVIKEVHRFFSLTTQISRQLERDVKIGAHVFPKGTTIMINIAGIHHDPDLYPDPYRFNPDNFTPLAISRRHRCSFMPFSLGARNCIGQASAELDLKLRLVAFLRRFTFHTTMKIENISDNSRPGPFEVSLLGYPMSIKLRTKSSQDTDGT